MNYTARVDRQLHELDRRSVQPFARHVAAVNPPSH
jgi:hypothetical protein